MDLPAEACRFLWLIAPGLGGGSASMNQHSPKHESPILLWIAQGFGAGRMPLAPGTFGSLVGLLWFAALVSLPSSISMASCLLGIAVSVWSSAHAERILRQRDPGSVVVDEIAAVPLCFVSWMVLEAVQGRGWPSMSLFFSGPGLWRTCGLFLGFRLFDVWKPWPIRASQSLPGGWGITVDDLLAAGYVNLCFLGVHWVFNLV